MNQEGERQTSFQFNLRFLFVAVTLLGLFLAVPIIGVLLVSGMVGVLVFLGVVIALQFPIFMLIRRRLTRESGLPSEDHALPSAKEEHEPVSSAG